MPVVGLFVIAFIGYWLGLEATVVIGAAFLVLPGLSRARQQRADETAHREDEDAEEIERLENEVRELRDRIDELESEE